MQSEIDMTNSLRQCIAKFEAENVKIKAENDKIIAENVELKTKVAKLEDKQLENELVKNLLSVPWERDHLLMLAKVVSITKSNVYMISE